MSHKLQPARGTKDILADDYRVFSHVQNIARDVSSLYGFKEISTPMFEFTEIFEIGRAHV
jgi:histidyl-tRNA synthetase